MVLVITLQFKKKIQNIKKVTFCYLQYLEVTCFQRIELVLISHAHSKFTRKRMMRNKPRETMNGRQIK